MKQIQAEHTGTKPIIKVPKRKITVSQVVDDCIVMHQILLHGVGADILKYWKFAAEYETMENDKTADKGGAP